MILGAIITCFRMKKPSGKSPAAADTWRVQKEKDGAVLGCNVIINMQESHSIMSPVVNRKYRFSFRVGLKKTTSNPTNVLPVIPVIIIN